MQPTPRPAPTKCSRRIGARLRSLIRDETQGSVTLEMAFVIPMLIMMLLTVFVYFDAFRTRRTNVSAAYTISDMLSRHTEPVTAGSLEGAHDLYDYVTRARFPTSFRVSSVYYNVIDERFMVVWSHATRGLAPLTTAALQANVERLPPIPRGDTVILVEAGIDYRPPFGIGLGDQAMRHLVATRPRFAPQVVFDNGRGTIAGLTPCQQNLVTCGW